MNITLVNMKVSVSPEFLAKCFWEMYAEEQVEFFEELAKIADSIDFENQIDAINDVEMSEKAKNIMHLFGKAE